jgi:hypothetical protein
MVQGLNRETMKYSKGIFWLDDCRIPFVETENIDFNYRQSGKVYGGISLLESKTEYTNTNFDTKGRFTPNLLVSDDALNDGKVSKGQKNPRIQKTTKRYGENNFTNGGLYTPEGNITDTYNDKGSKSRFYDIDLWFKDLINKL